MTLFCNPLLCRKGWQASFAVLPLLRPMPLELEEASQALEGRVSTPLLPYSSPRVCENNSRCMAQLRMQSLMKCCRSSALDRLHSSVSSSAPAGR